MSENFSLDSSDIVYEILVLEITGKDTFIFHSTMQKKY